MRTNRREFLKSGALGVSMSFLAPGIIRQELLADAPGEPNVLVVLQMQGGNDALNTFIPYTDGMYRELRPTLSLREADVLPLDDRMAFHRELAPLVPFWQKRKFAFANAVGFDSLDRSHFHCEDVWQTGSEMVGHGHHRALGWLGRWADLELGEAAGPVATTAMGSLNALGLSGHEVLPAIVSDPAKYGISPGTGSLTEDDAIRAALRRSFAGTRDGFGGRAELVRTRGEATFRSIDLVSTLPPQSAVVTYPATELGRSFSIAARLIASGGGARVIWIRLGGFDTHAHQLQFHPGLLTDMAGSLAAFQTDLEHRGDSGRVVVMAWSEFGRRAFENASGGTDHGKGGTVFLLGDRIEGGQWIGDLPDFARLDEGDVRSSIDFRAVYATLIDDWLGGDSEAVLGGRYENVGLIAPARTGRRRSISRR